LYDSLERIIADDRCILYVAEIEKRLVGFAEAYIRIDEPDPKRISYKYCRLQSLMVREEFRRRRIGALLTERIEQWAGEKGCSEVRLDIWEFGEGPLKFYEHAGYRILRRTMVRRL
jgi:GNAT superfamily N-acetyltransferase